MTDINTLRDSISFLRSMREDLPDHAGDSIEELVDEYRALRAMIKAGADPDEIERATAGLAEYVEEVMADM